MDGEISVDSEFLDLLDNIPTDQPNIFIPELEGVMPGSERLNETIQTMQGLNVSGPLGRIIKQTIGPEITENRDNHLPPVYTISVPAPSRPLGAVNFPILTHEIKITNQPEKNDYKFRHETEKNHAMPIKSKRTMNNGSSWPEIHVTDAPACPADIWIQLVENRSPVDGHDNPYPSPNGLFHKRSREWTAPHGIIIHDNGEKDGVVKLKIPNLSVIQGKISFDEHLQLALFRTRAVHAWDYLEKRNETNRNTPDKIQRLSQIVIPSNKKNKDAKKRCRLDIDTTRVKLCFQVFLHIGNLYPDIQKMDSAPLIHSLNPVCSDTIVDKHAHQLLKIDCIAPITFPDTAIDHGIILCSKIEDSDQNKLKLIFTFKDEKGNEKDAECPIPKKNPSLIHRQVAIKFGKLHGFHIPAYRDVFKKIDIHSHVHATVRLVKYSANMKQLLEESNPVDLTIFPEGYEKQMGRCIGSPSETDDLTCEYSIKPEPIKTEPEPQKDNGSLMFSNAFGRHTMLPPESQKPLVSPFKFGTHQIIHPEDPAKKSIALNNITKRKHSQVLPNNTDPNLKSTPIKAPLHVPQNQDSSNMNTEKAINMAADMEKDYPGNKV
jgi:hypothetical protein